MKKSPTPTPTPPSPEPQVQIIDEIIEPPPPKVIIHNLHYNRNKNFHII
jgi:hypothetical protein